MTEKPSASPTPTASYKLDGMVLRDIANISDQDSPDIVERVVCIGIPVDSPGKPKPSTRGRVEKQLLGM